VIRFCTAKRLLRRTAASGWPDVQPDQITRHGHHDAVSLSVRGEVHLHEQRPRDVAADAVVLPRTYATAVNIHNPNARPVRFRMKLAAATATEVDPPQITDFLHETLKPDQATRVDCSRVKEFGPPPIHGFEGFSRRGTTALAWRRYQSGGSARQPPSPPPPTLSPPSC
jgi:hypothetical protein